MKEKEIEDKVRGIIKKLLVLDETPRNNQNLYNDLGMDSLDGVELIMSIEKEFNIAIPDEKLEDMSTVEDALEIVKEFYS